MASSSTILYETLYHAVQRLRGGVNSTLIRQASRLLDAKWTVVLAHAEERISAVHGSPVHALEWLSSQPVVERHSLRDVMAQAAAASGRRRVEHRRTSGSTGTPFALVKDVEMTARMDAAMWAAYAWHGIRPGLPHARFWGMPADRATRTKKRFIDALNNRRRFDAFKCAPSDALAFYQRLQRIRPVYAYGYPTLIRHFVDMCAAQGLAGTDLGIGTVVTTGELLAPDARKVIGDYFGARVVNEYGCTESGVIGFECHAGTMHVIPVAAWPEVVDSSNGTARTDGIGEIVVTDLYGQTAPLRRYRLHDRGLITFRDCACGRDLPVLEVQTGRVDSFITTPTRGRVYDAILAYSVPPAVQRFRARQLSATELHVDLVPGAGFDPSATPAECRRRWEAALGPGMTVITRVVDFIPYESSGKLRYFIPLEDTGAGEAVTFSEPGS
jgi:phenylacetate-CoA ligase